MRTSFKILSSLLAAVVSAVNAEPLLMDNLAYQQCEGEAFLSLIIARNGMHLNNTRQSLLEVKSNGAFQIETINELFDEIDKTGSKEHGQFAAKKFYQCTKREGLPIKENLDGAKVCLARQDVVFYVNDFHRSGDPQPEALAKIKRYVEKSSKAVYPDDLIDLLVPMVYRVTTDEDEYELRRLVFRTCLLPNEWNAWYKPPTQSTAQSSPPSKNELSSIAAQGMVAANALEPKPTMTPRATVPAIVSKGTSLPPDRSGIYVYRDEWMGAFVKMEVLVDDDPLGQTSAKTYLYKEVAPGKHIVVSKAENTESIEVETLPGTITYIWQEVKMGFGSARSKLSVVDSTTGKKGIAETKPVFPAMAQVTTSSPPAQSASRPREAKAAVLGPFRPSKPLHITLDMVRGHTWRYPHPTDFEKNGNTELVFSDTKVQGTNKIGGSMGSFDIRDDAICLALVSWTSFCFYVIEEDGQKMVFFSGRGGKSKLTID